MTKSIKLSDGTVLRTASQRRFVTFAIADDSYVYVVKRTDNFQTAFANHRRARGKYCRTVTVDFHPRRLPFPEHDALPAPQVEWDSADFR